MNKATQEELDKFNKLVVQWFSDGKLYISPRMDYHGEPKQENFDVILEFAAGGERIGNDGSGSFSWGDLLQMSKEQGLV
jgi:hypothetical protein